MEVDRIVESEQRRKAYVESSGQGDVDDADWRMWAHHDRLLGVEE